MVSASHGLIFEPPANRGAAHHRSEVPRERPVRALRKGKGGHARPFRSVDRQDIFHRLVVWNMNFMTFHILGKITPTDELIFFRGVQTTNQVIRLAEIM